MNTFLFLDVNVWVALAHARHPHHERANVWIDSINGESSLHFCRITQLGLLRVLTTPSVMGDEVMTQSEAWQTYDLFFRDSRIQYAEEPRRMDTAFRAKTVRDEVSAKQWADGYLAAFALASEMRLVTFDKALAKMVPKAILL